MKHTKQNATPNWKLMRVTADLTLQELAAQINFSTPLLSSFERGATGIAALTRQKLEAEYKKLKG